MYINRWFLFPLLLISSATAQELSNLLNTTQHRCIRCLCHAVSGCYVLQNCAMYSVSYSYWVQAGSPRVDIDDGINENAYQACLKDDNCILHTINNYTNRGGSMDCNCDGEFNCEDMFAIHYNQCSDPMSIKYWEERKGMFRDCSGLQLDDPTPNCLPKIL